LSSLAAEFDARAARVEAIGAQLVHAAAVALWSSVAADAFRAQVARRQRQCITVADELRGIGSAVRRFAANAEAEKRRIERLVAAGLRDVEHVAAAGCSLATRGVRDATSWLPGL